MITFTLDDEQYTYDGSEIKPVNPNSLSSFVSMFLNLFTDESRGYLPLQAQLNDVIRAGLPNSKLTILSNTDENPSTEIDGIIY